MIYLFNIALTVVGSFGLSSSAFAYGIGDADPRSISLGQSYTALARGPQAIFWNPANLALSDNPKFAWQLISTGITLVAENNSFSVQTYNDNFTQTDNFIDSAQKNELLGDIAGDTFKFNVDTEPHLGVLLPLANRGVAFPLPMDIRSAIAIGFKSGLDGGMPRDMFQLILTGNEFDEQYDIARWNGSGWAIGSFNWAFARAFMPSYLKDYLTEFTVGGTIKMVGGGLGEILQSSGGFIARKDSLNIDGEGGLELDAHIVSQIGGGSGFGVDIGIAGVTTDRKTTLSLALLNIFDTLTFDTGMPEVLTDEIGKALKRDFVIDSVRQDEVVAVADTLYATRFIDPGNRDIGSVFNNKDIDRDGDGNPDGNPDFHTKIGEQSFSRSLPGIVRLGVAHRPLPRLVALGNVDYVFSDGFGLTSGPRISGGAEYRLVPWFPTRIGLTFGGRSSGLAVGFAFGPFDLPHVRLELLDLAVGTRGGFFPGVAKGTAISVNFFQLEIR